MAVEDLSREGLNNQKRGICVAAVEGLTEGQTYSFYLVAFDSQGRQSIAIAQG